MSPIGNKWTTAVCDRGEHTLCAGVVFCESNVPTADIAGNCACPCHAPASLPVSQEEE